MVVLPLCIWVYSPSKSTENKETVDDDHYYNSCFVSVINGSTLLYFNSCRSNCDCSFKLLVQIIQLYCVVLWGSSTQVNYTQGNTTWKKIEDYKVTRGVKWCSRAAWYSIGASRKTVGTVGGWDKMEYHGPKFTFFNLFSSSLLLTYNIVSHWLKNLYYFCIITVTPQRFFYLFIYLYEQKQPLAHICTGTDRRIRS